LRFIALRGGFCLPANIPSPFIGSTSNSLNAQTKASTRSGEYPAAARSVNRRGYEDV
jgi:hypothetical protein